MLNNLEDSWVSGYYRRFIKNYAAIAGPLTNLLKKEAFKWNDQAT